MSEVPEPNRPKTREEIEAHNRKILSKLERGAVPDRGAGVGKVKRNWATKLGMAFKTGSRR